MELAHCKKLSTLSAADRKELKEAEEWMSQSNSLDKPGKHEKGAELAEKALGVRERLLGDSLLTAASAFKAGQVLQSATKKKEATERFKQVWEIRQKILGDHPETAAALSRLGEYLTQQGQYADGRDYHRLALRMRLKLSGPADDSCKRVYDAFKGCAT